MSKYTPFSEGPSHPSPLYTSNLAAHGELHFPRAGDRSLVHESVRNGSLSACQLDAAAHGEGGHIAKLREDQVEREVVAAIVSHARGTGHELARRLESYAAV